MYEAHGQKIPHSGKRSGRPVPGRPRHAPQVCAGNLDFEDDGQQRAVILANRVRSFSKIVPRRILVGRFLAKRIENPREVVRVFQPDVLLNQLKAARITLIDHVAHDHLLGGWSLAALATDRGEGPRRSRR